MKCNGLHLIKVLGKYMYSAGPRGLRVSDWNSHDVEPLLAYLILCSVRLLPDAVIMEAFLFGAYLWIEEQDINGHDIHGIKGKSKILSCNKVQKDICRPLYIVSTPVLMPCPSIYLYIKKS